MTSVEAQLQAAVEDAAPALLASSDAAAAKPPAPGKWSAKQVVGHLIDSAANNHSRFVRSQFTEDFVFPGYEQQAWVTAQRYQDAPWAELVGLWRSYNLHLSRVIAAIPAAVRQAPRIRHNLHEIAWHPVPQNQPATLAYFLQDYVDHMNHHLGQAFRALGEKNA